MKKKILVVSSYNLTNGTSATEITLRSYFSGNNKFIIKQLICGITETKRDNESFSLSIKDLRFNPILKLLYKNKPNVSTNGVSNVIPKKKSAFEVLKLKVIFTLRGLLDLIPYKISNNLDEFISDFNPDYIYTLPASVRISKLVNDLSIKYSTPIIPHFMDDCLTTLYNDSKLMFLIRKFYLHHVNKLIDNSFFTLCISELMCKEYKRRYPNVEFYPLMHCINEYHEPQLLHAEKLKICYSGGFHLSRIDVIIELCELINKTNKDDVELYFFTSETNWVMYSEQLKKYSFVKYLGFKTPEYVYNYMLDNFNVLLHVESFDENVSIYTKYSISTKIPEYLSLGKMVLAIGPKDVASIKYLKDNDAAIVIDDENNKDIWLEKIESLKKGNDNKQILFNAKNLFIKNHLCENVIDNLYNLLVKTDK